ncbi:MAG: RrF2 family transcriptional regulator [Candidatus Krumholzibacteriia bacterium]
MVYSKSTQYAIRAMAQLAIAAPGEYVRTRDVARSSGVPLPFLSKITQELARHGLVQSLRGRGGGICLTRPPREITLADIVMAVDGEDVTGSCILGLPKCGDESPCPVHEEWKKLRAHFRKTLHERTLADLAQSLKAKRRRRLGRSRAGAWERRGPRLRD